MSLDEYHRQRSLVSQAARRAIEVTGQLPAELRPDAAPVGAALERLETGRFQVAFIGQMKVGKSSLVNALIFGREVLPVAATPHTARLSVVRHGDTEQATVRFIDRETWAALRAQADRERKSIREAIAQGLSAAEGAVTGLPASQERTLADQLDEAERRLGSELQRLLGTERVVRLDEISEYGATTDDVDGKYVAITREIAIEAPHRWPADVEFVDTPGLFDPVRARSQVTLDYLKRADAVVFIIFSGAPMSRPDAEFLSQALLPVGVGKIIVTLNKIDAVPPEQRGDVTTYVRRSLLTIVDTAAKLLGGDGPWRQALDVKGEVFATSGLLALLGRSRGTVPPVDTRYHWRRLAEDGLGLPDLESARSRPEVFEQALQASGVPEFEAALERFLVEQKGRLLLAGPLSKASAALLEASRNIVSRRAQVEAQRADLVRSAMQLEAEIAQRQDERVRLDKGLAEVNAQLGLWVNEALRGRDARMQERLAACVEDARRSGHRIVDAAGRWELATSQATAMRVNTAMGYAVREVPRELNREVREVLEELRRSVQDRLPGALRTHLGGLVPSQSLSLAVDTLERVAFEYEGLDLGVVIDDLGFWSPLFGAERARQELNGRVDAELQKYNARWVGEIRSLRGRFEQGIAVPFRQIEGELRGALNQRITDIERAIDERKRQQPNIAADQTRLDAELRHLSEHDSRVVAAREVIAQASREAGVDA